MRKFLVACLIALTMLGACTKVQEQAPVPIGDSTQVVQVDTVATVDSAQTK